MNNIANIETIIETTLVNNNIDEAVLVCEGTEVPSDVVEKYALLGIKLFSNGAYVFVEKLQEGVFHCYRNPTGRAGVFYSGNDISTEARWGLQGLRIDLRSFFGAIAPKYLSSEFRAFGPKPQGYNFSDKGDEGTHVPVAAIKAAAEETLAYARENNPANKIHQKELEALIAFCS